jgi:muconolactone delta-isomerase
MALRDLMLEDLGRGLAMVRDGHEIVPTWRIIAPEGDYLILTRFDPDKPEEREQMLTLVPAFHGMEDVGRRGCSWRMWESRRCTH